MDPEPGLELVFSQGEPRCELLPLTMGRIVLGRRTEHFEIADPQVSREHVEVVASGESIIVRDLGSRNGTFLGGSALRGQAVAPKGAVLRIGQTLFLIHHDIRPLMGSRVVSNDDIVAGPLLASALGAVSRAAQGTAHLLIHGESGTGKEIAARVFHRSCAPAGPFVAVNCATIPVSLAESLLFGARKGAFSGAVADTPGLLAKADRGVLFFDEVAELDLQVQAKLLRVLETGEVLALGDVRPKPVALRVCSATLCDVRARVAEGRFRDDLYHRLAGSQILLPPLRERRHEIPYLVAKEIGKQTNLAAQAEFVEACLLRSWPGNVRALRSAVAEAAARAAGEQSSLVRKSHLPGAAGQPFETRAATDGAGVATSPELARRSPQEVSREELESSLKMHDGNVAAASRSLGLHRTQLYRLMRALGVRAEPGGER
jgi:DNA-binding NtrC family response regulator